MRTAWLFPGQGSQFCGMGRELWSSFEPARQILHIAEELSGMPLGSYSLRGPAETLMRTDVLQPAVTAMNIGCSLMLRKEGYQPAMAAGHSLGEFSALFAAGVLTAHDTLALVVKRGRLMRQAAERQSGAMLAVKGLRAAEVESLVAASAGQVCVANYNAPDQIAVSGSPSALRDLAKAVRAVAGQTMDLPVAGAWHSSMMDEAAAEFACALDEAPFKDAQCPVFANNTGQPETSGAMLRNLLKRQMNAPVRWCQTLDAMRLQGVNSFLEVGPGKVLRGLLRRIWTDEPSYLVRGIDGPQSLAFLQASVMEQGA